MQSMSRTEKLADALMRAETAWLFYTWPPADSPEGRADKKRRARLRALMERSKARERKANA